MADAEFTEPTLRDDIINELWNTYRKADFSVTPVRAIKILAFIKPENLIDSFIEELASEESSVRVSAAYALGSLGSEKAVEPLIKALTTDKKSDVRGGAAYALGSLGSENAVEPLLKALTTDKVSYVRKSAASALGSLGSEKAVEPLMRYLTDEGTSIYTGGTVGYTAFAALEKICRRHKIRIPLERLPKRKA